MRISIDEDVCQGHGRCYTISPEVFDADDQGHAFTTRDEVDPAIERSVREAVASCPERAIRLTDTGVPA